MTDADCCIAPLTPTPAAIARRMGQSKRAAPPIDLTTAIEIETGMAWLAERGGDATDLYARTIGAHGLGRLLGRLVAPATWTDGGR